MTRIFALLMLVSVIAEAKQSPEADINTETDEAGQAMLEAQAPYIAKARATYPKAKARFLAGLPPGDRFMIRKHIIDTKARRVEGTYIEVETIKNGTIYGRIASDINLPSYHPGDRVSLPESDLEDWAIFHRNGGIEGNVVVKFLKSAKSRYSNDMALSSGDIATIKQICRQFIGSPFSEADRWMQLSPYVRKGDDLYQPMTVCGRSDYCSGGIRLRDDTQFLYSYLHVTPKGKRDNGDITPDRGRKGNNRFVGVTLIRHGKTVLSEGHLDRETIDRYLRDRDSHKAK